MLSNIPAEIPSPGQGEYGFIEIAVNWTQFIFGRKIRHDLCESFSVKCFCVFFFVA